MPLAESASLRRGVEGILAAAPFIARSGISSVDMTSGFDASTPEQ